MTLFPIRRWMLMLTMLAATAACGDDVVECPEGTVRQGDACVLVGTDSGIGNDAGTPNDGGSPDTGLEADGGSPDTGNPVDSGVNPGTGLPDQLDFGRVVVGDERSLSITLENTSTEPVLIRVGLIGGPAAQDFTLTASATIPAGGYTLDPNTTLDFTVRFAPRAAGARMASVAFDLCDSGCSATLALVGEGLLDAISCAPASVDFGLVNPGSCASASLTCTNDSSYDAVLFSASFASGSGPFGLATGTTFPSNLGAGAQQTVDLMYCPSAIGPDQDTLELDTMNPNPARGPLQIPLAGEGGGPDIACNPSSVDFGTLGTGQAVVASITCDNSGSTDLTINQVAFSGTSAAEFSVSSTGTASLPPGGQSVITIQFSAAAAGTFSGVLEITSDDRDTPIFAITTNAEAIEATGCALSVQPAQIDLGAVRVGRSARGSSALQNVGTGSCAINLLGLTPQSAPEFSLITGLQTVTLAPGESFTVEAELTPGATQNYVGAIELVTSDPALPLPLTIDLIGDGTDASYPVVVNPTAIDFGDIQAGCANTAERPLVVTNFGGPISVVVSLEPGSSNAFTVQGSTTTSVLVLTNGSVSIPIGFLPSTLGRHTGRLRVEPLNLPPVFVSLDGNADPAARNVEVFTAPPTPIVDMLLVVDDSCSMTEEQQSLGQTAATLIARADASGADYHIGVTTTDPGDGGNLVPAGTLRGSPAFVTGLSPSRITDLQAAINQGTAGSAIEQGLYAASEAVTNSALLGGSNMGFLRANADLIVLILSDEEDQSPDTVAQYVNLMNSRPSGGSLRIYSITGGLQGCVGAGGSAQASARYVQADGLTGGFDRSICDLNYNAFITEIADEAFDPLRNSYPLQARPAPDSVEVFANNVPIASVTGTVAVWGVDYDNLRVVFAPGQAPAGASNLRIEYDAFCVSASCGDTTTQVGEQCDDGNADDTDACPSTCYNASCGDGFVASATEGCDDGNTIGGDGCNAQCIVEGCGNGIIESGEECDDGNANSDVDPDACRTTCVLAACHDNVVDTGEACDDGNFSDQDACPGECVVAFCGDGFVFPPGEACDDGNNIDTDGCTNSCALNVLSFTVTTIPVTPLVPTAGTPIGFPGTADDQFQAVSVGFPFSFLGAAVTDAFPSTNGFIGFVAGATTFQNAVLPNALTPNGFIAWWWDDLHMGLTLTPAVQATTALLGTTPNRIRVFTFLNVPHYGALQGDALVNAEVRLYEGTNVIEVHYGTPSAGNDAFNATVGWESPDGLFGVDVLGCGSACSLADWPSDTIYRYTP